MDFSVFQDFLQWLGIGTTGGVAMHAMGKKDQKIADHDRRLSEVEELARKAISRTEDNGKLIARVETKQDLMYDLLQKMDTKLDERTRP
tara:strand:+ start:264 stop:530 length:267 start_codon:yes stop_codon:yes gene_type:complete